jgi:hypothetical protein
VTSAHHVVLRGHNGPADPDALRRVGYRAPETGNHAVFWTHALPLAAPTLAALSHARWPLALVFKTITPHRTITTGLGPSDTAVMTPMGSALRTSLRRAFLRFKRGWGLSCPQRRRLLPMTLFDRRHLVE